MSVGGEGIASSLAHNDNTFCGCLHFAELFSDSDVMKILKGELHTYFCKVLSD